jgi:hypothetical protein
MNVFVLTTGRSGSKTVSYAFREATNFSVGHESSRARPADRRFDYPPRHIEVDCRAVWFLPILLERYPDSFWVHLIRDREATIKSLWTRAILRAYRSMLNSNHRPDEHVVGMAEHYYNTVNHMIELFVRQRTARNGKIVLGQPETFRAAWDRIGCQGDIHQALEVFATRHNTGKETYAQEDLCRHPG